MNFKPSNNFLKKLALQAKEKFLGLKDHKIAYRLVKTSAVGTILSVVTAGSVVLAEKMIPENPSMSLKVELVPDSSENTNTSGKEQATTEDLTQNTTGKPTTSDIEKAVTEALPQNKTEEPTYTSTQKPTDNNVVKPVVTTIPIYDGTDIVATETSTYYVDPTTNTVKTTTTKKQPSTQATTTKKQTIVTTPKQTSKVTTVTTQKPTQPQTQPPTQPSTQAPTQPPKTEYVLEDIKTDPDAYAYFAEKMRKDIYNGKTVFGKYGSSKGYTECIIMLAILNTGINGENPIKPEVLADGDCLGAYVFDTICNYSEITDFACLMNVTGGEIDFTEYMFDKEMAKYMNDITAKSTKLIKTGDDTELLKAIQEYNQKLKNVGENNLKYYEIMFTTNALYSPYVGGDKHKDPIANADTYKQWKEKMIERDIKPLYNNYTQYKNKAYTK